MYEHFYFSWKVFRLGLVRKSEKKNMETYLVLTSDMTNRICQYQINQSDSGDRQKKSNRNSLNLFFFFPGKFLKRSIEKKSVTNRFYRTRETKQNKKKTNLSVYYFPGKIFKKKTISLITTRVLT